MAWTNSKIFTAYIHDVLCNTSAADLDTDALIEAALFDGTITPNQVDTAAHNAYAAAGGTWASGGVVDTGTGAPAGWPALGRPLAWSVATRVTAATANPIVFDSDDTVSASDTTTITNANGCLIYDHTAGTPTDEGMCYIYFGGAQSVTLGRFTIQWNASGVMSLTL
jgi:hypothetical protein